MIFGRKSRRQVEHEAFLEALRAVVEVSREQARAVEAMADALKASYDAYKTEGTPQVRVMDDLQELYHEHERLGHLHKAGFPVELPPVEQMQWVLEQSGKALA